MIRVNSYGRRKPLTMPTPVVGCLLSLMIVNGLQISPAVADPLEDALTGPSAAGERLMMERAGQELKPTAKTKATTKTKTKTTTKTAVQRKVSPARSGSAPSAPGGDAQVNNSAGDTPESTTQSETTMAVLGNTICAGYNDSGLAGFSGLARSTDLGATWTDLGGLGQRGDPVIAVHEASGTFYYAEIATIGGNPAIGVAASTDDCQTFGAPTDASPGASAIATTTLNDKPWIAVDNTGGSGDGNVYVCWTRFDSAPGSSSELRFSRSLDGGATYVNERILAPAGTGPFGCSVAVGPNGEVYVSWADRGGATIDDIRFRSSVDAGQNFSAAVSASTGNRHPGLDRIVTCGPNNRPTLNGNIRMLHQSWLAADTTGGIFSGNLYVVWASDPAGLTDNSDVFFSRSVDGGANWSAPLQLGAGGGATDQFEPFVAVGGLGTVAVAWYDRRNDDDNNNLIDVYRAFSFDGGLTFLPNVRVTDVSFPPPPILPNFDPGVAQCYMGEYIAVAGDDASFYYLWGDNRNTLVTANFPAGRPDPDIFFEAEAIVGVIPVCDADGPYTAECGVSTTLDGSGSSDPDGGSLSFEWSGPFDGSPAAGEMPSVVFPSPTGAKSVDLTVTDDETNSAICMADVTVQDTLAPQITAPADKTAECTSPDGALVDAMGPPTGSDLCDANVSFTTVPTTVYPIGTTTVIWTATDDEGNQASDTQDITVEDTTAPSVTASLTPVVGGDEDEDDNEGLYRINFSASDVCDTAPTVSAVLAVGTAPGVVEIEVVDGQVISFEVDDETEIESDDGILEIESEQLTLRAMATDANGNTAEAEAQPIGSGADDDDDDDDDDTVAFADEDD